MLIEEILPINYYNQLIGILVDTAILKILIKKLMPKLSAIIENNKDFDGHFIGEIFINKILINLFVNKSIDNNISLLILDYLFLKGNKVIFQAFLSIYQYLSNSILNGEKSIENFNNIINENLKNLKVDNQEFLYNLFFKYEKAISKININEYRDVLSIKVAESLEEKNIEYTKAKVRLCYNSELYKKQIDKFLKCKKDWPYCINDSNFENVTRVIDYLYFTKKEINYEDNYFFNKKQQKDKNIIKTNENEKKYYNLTLERRPHFCNDIQDELDLNKKEKDLNKIQIDENIIKDDIDEIKKDENNGENDTIKFIKNSMTTENFLNISKMIEEKIGDDIFLPDNDEEK